MSAFAVARPFHYAHSQCRKETTPPIDDRQNLVASKDSERTVLMPLLLAWRASGALSGVCVRASAERSRHSSSASAEEATTRRALLAGAVSLAAAGERGRAWRDPRHAASCGQLR